MNFLKFEGRIVILDDGTPQKYLDKIQQLFPDVEIKKSPYYEEKSNAILLGKDLKKVIPAMFWKEEVLKGTERFILLEDDMWFSKQVDIKVFDNEAEVSQVDMIKFLWLKNPKLISKKIIHQTKNFNIIQPKVLTQTPFLFESIFRTNRFKLGSVFRRLCSYDTELLKYYQLYVVAGGVFSKRYYETAWKSTKNTVDELLQIQEVISNLNNFKLGNTRTEIIKATYKFTASTIDKEKYGNKLDVFKLNKLLNEAWINEDYYNITDFENDVSSKWIEKCCQKTSVNYADWEQWYEQFKKSYENIGCIIV